MNSTSINNKKVLIKTFGCQMNEHDSEKILGLLSGQGYSQTNSANDADLIIYNTCCVREHAELRVFGNIGALAKIKRERPELMIAVCGCMMQQKDVAAKLYNRFPFVDIIFGTNSLHELISYIYRVESCGARVIDVCESDGTIVENIPVLRKDATSASVTIMYGCDNFCTYCVVPYVRGRERSRAPGDILREVNELALAGNREIMLLGQNVNSYNGGISFAKLLEQISKVDGIERIRFMTSHPKDLSRELIDTISAHENICRHIHLPVQSGSNRILELMNRGYTRERYFELINGIRQAVPGIELTSDFIVGFPTETDADFEDTLDLARCVGFAAAYTFMYSPRTGTRAAQMPQLDQQVKKQRLAKLNALQESVCKQNNKKYIGTVQRVLVEGIDQGGEPTAFGKTSSGRMIYFNSGELKNGHYATVEVLEARNNSLFGRQINLGAL